MMLFVLLVIVLFGFWVDSVVIFLVVVVNVLIGFVQEGKVVNVLDVICDMFLLYVLVLCDGQCQVLDVECLVLGDVVLLVFGDWVLVDLWLFEMKNFYVDELVLIGELVLVEKGCVVVVIDVLFGDCCCMVYFGILVISGQVCGVVVVIVGDIELGWIGMLLCEVCILVILLL